MQPCHNKSHIASLFNAIASSYDVTSTILSFGLSSVWNRTLCKVLLSHKKTAVHILDICSGTGAIPYTLHKIAPLPSRSITCVDFSSAMLTKAQAILHTTTWTYAFLNEDVSELSLASNSFDAITCAYGMRNIEEKKAALQQCYRVLRPGGSLFVLDLTKPKGTLLRAMHKAYIQWYLPSIGALISRNKDAYQYLSRSIQHFMEPEMLKQEFEAAGFTNTRILPLAGGIATIILGDKS